MWWIHLFLQGSEEQLRKEANLTDIPDNVTVDSDVSSVLAAYKSEGDPELYEYAYLELRRFVDESLDIYKVSNDNFFHRIYHLDGILAISCQCQFAFNSRLSFPAWIGADIVSRIRAHVSGACV